MSNQTKAVIKLSGNSLGYDEPKLLDPDELNIDLEKVNEYANNIYELYKRGFNPFTIVGGSNIANGEKLIRSGANDNKIKADLLGMEATHINVKAVYEVLEEMDVPVVMLSTLGRNDTFIPFSLPTLVELSERKEIICLIAGGTGFAGFTTDSAAALFAHNIGMEKIIKATDAGAIYNQDPRDLNKRDTLERIPIIDYAEVIYRDLRVMDLTAIAYCKQNDMEIFITGREDAETMERILKYGENPEGSLVTSKEKVLSLLNKKAL